MHSHFLSPAGGPAISLQYSQNVNRGWSHASSAAMNVRLRLHLFIRANDRSQFAKANLITTDVTDIRGGTIILSNGLSITKGTRNMLSSLQLNERK